MSSQKRLIAILLSLILLPVVGSCASAPNTGLNTPSPSATATEIAATPTRTLTFTPIPTLSQEKAYSRFEELLLDNGKCGLPCWWEIVPGKSSFQEARAAVVPLTAIATWNSMGVWNGTSWSEFFISYPNGTDNIRIDINFRTLPNQNEVSMLNILSYVQRPIADGAENVFDDNKYLDLMRNYTLSSILSTYGKPDQAGLYVYIAPDGGWVDTIYLRLYYSGQGIFVQYQFRATANGGQISGCPSKSLIELWLVSPPGSISYWKDLYPEVGYMGAPLDKAINMDIDSFYQTFKEPTNRCLETPLSLWPGP